MNHDIWSIIALIGLTGWIVATLCLIFKAFPGRGNFDCRAGRKWGIVLAVFYGIWIAGLLNA